MSQNDDLERLLLQTAQRLATVSARQDALQSVLVATLIALSKSNPRGGTQIEQIALRFSEGIASAKGDTSHADEIRRQTETILATVRAALTGKAV